MNNPCAIPALLATLLLVTSCTATSSGDRSRCPRLSASDYCFARLTVDPSNEHSDTFSRHWYSEQLAAMQEPSLSCGQIGTTYRFTWLRSFHHPVALRVTDNGDHVVLRAIELEGGCQRDHTCNIET